MKQKSIWQESLHFQTAAPVVKQLKIQLQANQDAKQDNQFTVLGPCRVSRKPMAFTGKGNMYFLGYRATADGEIFPSSQNEISSPKEALHN